MKRNLNSTSSLGEGDWCRTSKNSRYKGLNVGRDALGFYVYYNVYNDIRNKMIASSRYLTALDIPDKEIETVLESLREAVQ